MSENIRTSKRQEQQKLWCVGPSTSSRSTLTRRQTLACAKVQDRVNRSYTAFDLTQVSVIIAPDKEPPGMLQVCARSGRGQHMKSVLLTRARFGSAVITTSANRIMSLPVMCRVFRDHAKTWKPPPFGPFIRNGERGIHLALRDSQTCMFTHHGGSFTKEGQHRVVTVKPSKKWKPPLYTRRGCAHFLTFHL